MYQILLRVLSVTYGLQLQEGYDIVRTILQMTKLRLGGVKQHTQGEQ